MIQICTSVYSEFILVCIQFERLHCNTVERILYSESHSIKHRNRYASHLFLPPKFACPITRLTCFLPPQSTFWRTKWYCKYFFLKCFLSPKLALNCHKNIFHCLQIVLIALNSELLHVWMSVYVNMFTTKNLTKLHNIIGEEAYIGLNKTNISFSLCDNNDRT